MKSRASAAFLVLAVTVFSFAALSAPLAHAAGVPTILSYQGRLTDSSGSLLGTAAGTTYYFKFSIWNNATVGSGTRLWPSAAPTSYSTLVRQGVFSVNIGDTAGGYPDALDYDFATEKNVFLQVEVSSNGTSFETLEPRSRIGASSFAQLAGAVSGTTTPSSFGTTTPIGSSMVTIEATSTATVPLSIRAASGQSANIFSIENSAATKLFYVAASGGLFASSTLQVSGLATLYGGATTTDITVSGGFFQGALADCSSESQNLLYTSSTGKFSCGFDATGGGGGTELNWTYVATEANSSRGRIYVSTTTNQVVIGASATTTLAKLEVIGDQYVSALLGIGTTTPGTPLSVTGAGVFTGIVTAPSFRATSTLAASVFPYASTTALTVSGAASTTNLTVSSLGTGSAKCVQADASGVLSAAAAACGSGSGASFGQAFELLSDGVTLSPTTTQKGLLINAASSTITNLVMSRSTTTAATTTSLAVTSVTSSLLKTTSSGSLIAAVAGTDYLSTALASIGPANDVATGPAIVLATSSTAYQGLTASTTITRSTNTLTFANTLSGTLAAGGGGTGLSATPTFGQILRGTGTGYTLVATSTLGIAISDTTGTLAVARGGTGVTAFGGANTLLYTTSANTLSSIALGTAGQVLAVSGGAPAWVATTTFSSGLTYAAGNVTLNTANANTWSALQQFNANASTTALTASGFSYLATAGGRVGIGTTSPFAKLSVHFGTADTNTMIFAIASSTASATTTLFSVDNTGLTTIGDSSGTGDAAFQFAADTNAWSMGYFATDKTFRIASSTNLSANVHFQIGKSGTTTLNSGITTSNTGQYLCIDATTFEIIRNNTACSASSARFKENILDLSYGLDDVLKLRPVTFTFRQEMNWGTSTQIGFIAEEVEAVVPELVSYDNDGAVTSVNYPVMVSLLAKAIQDLDLRLEDIASSTASSTPDSSSFSARFFDNAFARITAWLADAANGVGDLFAERLRTNELCVGDGAGETCITKAQLDALLLNAMVSGGGAPVPAQTEVVTEPAPEPAATTTEPLSAPEPAPEAEAPASDTDTSATSTTP